MCSMIFANLFFSVWLDTDGGGVTVNLRQAGAHILAVSPELPGDYKGNICVGMCYSTIHVFLWPRRMKLQSVSLHFTYPKLSPTHYT